MTGAISEYTLATLLGPELITVANKGFIAQYGTALNAKGEVILAADILAAWGGIQSAGQGFGMLSQHLYVTASRIES